MKIVAVIEPLGSQSPITESSWLAIVRKYTPTPIRQRREGINPFTKKKVVLPERESSVLEINTGSTMGSIEWAQDGSNCLLARLESGEDEDALVAVARDIAAALGVTCNIEHDLVTFSRS